MPGKVHISLGFRLHPQINLSLLQIVDQVLFLLLPFKFFYFPKSSFLVVDVVVLGVFLNLI